MRTHLLRYAYEKHAAILKINTTTLIRSENYKISFLENREKVCVTAGVNVIYRIKWVYVI